MTQKILSFTDIMKLDSEKEAQKKAQKEAELKLIEKKDQPDLKTDQVPITPDITLENSSKVEEFSKEPTKISKVEEFSKVENSSNLETENLKIRLENSSNLKGYLRMPNWILDEMPKYLDHNEQLLYIHLFRLSHGYGQEHCLVSLEKLGFRVGMTYRTVQKNLITLENKGMIKKIGYHFGNVKVKGTTIWVENFSKVENSSKPARLENSSNIKSEEKETLKKTYAILVRQFREIFPEASIGEIAAKVKEACREKKIHFDFNIFNNLDNKLWI